MRPVAFVLACATLAPLLGSTALAATPDKKRPGRYKVGPFYLTPKLELKNAGVDTNVFNTQTGQVPDTSIVLSPSVAGALPIGRRYRLTGLGYLDFNYFRRESTERSTDFAAEGRGEVDVGRFTYFAGGGGGQFNQRFSIDLDERLLRQEKWGVAGFDLAATNKFSTTLSGTGRIYSFAASQLSGTSVQKALDRNTLTGTAQFRYALTAQTKLVATADAIEDRFLQQIEEPRTTRSYRYMAGLEFGERAVVNGKLLAGLRRFPGGQGTPTYRGLALAVSASTRLWRVGRVTGLADRDVFYSASSSGDASELVRNTFVLTSLRAEGDFELPLDLVGRGFLGLQQSQYLAPFDVGGRPLDRVDHLWTAGASVLRRIGDTISVGGTVAWNRRVSNLPGQSYEGFRYGVQAAVVP